MTWTSRFAVFSQLQHAHLVHKTTMTDTPVAAAASAAAPAAAAAAAPAPASNGDYQEKSDTESRRYQHLLLALEKTLTESKRTLDARSAASEAFGNDTHSFDEDGGKSGVDVLADLVHECVDTANDQVREGIAAVLQSNDAAARLALLDRLLDHYDRADRTVRDAEESDRASARDAVQDVALPDGVDVMDVLSYQAYRIKVQERDALLAELASVEAENDAIARQIEKGSALIQDAVQEVEGKGKVLDKTADVGSFSGVS